MKIDGGCHCGYITYAAEADPERTTICHCTDCQRLSGSAFRVVVRVAGDTFKITAGLPSMWNTNLLDRRRRRTEILLHPCRDRPPTCCACPATTDLVSLTTRVGDRSRLHPQAGKAVSRGALIGCEESIQTPAGASRKSACISVRQGSPRSKHVRGDQPSPGWRVNE